MARLRLNFLGGFKLTQAAGGDIAVPSHKVQALIAYLAAGGPSRPTRERLAALLWSDRGDEQARHSLRQAVLTLRKTLSETAGGDAMVVAEGDKVGLDLDLVSVDVRAFERLAASGARADLEQATALYAGDFLEGLEIRSEGFDEWLAGERLRLRDLACDVLARLAELRRDAGETEPAVEAAQRLIAVDPLREDGHRLLMRLHDAAGRRAAALRQYQSCVDLLRRDLDAEPAAETRQLYDKIRTRQEGVKGAAPPARPGLPRRRWTIAAAALAVIAVAVAAVWWQPWIERDEPASVERMAFPLPDKPSIAVLPFDNLSGDPEQEYFADGFTENIIATLSQIPDLFVIARNSTFTYKGKPVKVQEVAEDLGVQYVLAGSVQRSGRRVRINAQLVDALTGRHLWADRYDREVGDIFVLQDEISLKVVTALQVELTEGEQERMRLVHGTGNLQAWITAAEALWHLRRLTPRDNLHARQLYEAAIAQDQSYPGAWDGLAWTHLTEAMFGWSGAPEKSLGTAGELAKKTLELDPARPGTYALLGMIKLFMRQHDEAIALGEKAVALSPSGADVAALLAYSLSFSGELERSIEMTKRAMRLSPQYPTWYAWSLGRVRRLTGDYDEAIKALKTRREGAPDSLPPHVDLVIAYMWSGRQGPARVEAKRVMQMAPVFTVARWARGQPYREKTVLMREIAALRQAGLPE